MSNKLANKKNKKEKPSMKPVYTGVGILVAVLVLLLVWQGRTLFRRNNSGAATAATETSETQTDAADTTEAQANSEDTTEAQADETDTTETQADAAVSDAEGPVVTISVKDYGDITVQLDEQAAPITVENFVSLARDGFYDGLTFHRIIDGFMIQGGDPLGNGTGGSEQTIKGEFSQNGVDNPISHKRGVISMARSQDMDSASSQFFIVQTDSPHLDGSYAGFGYVTSGMEIVDQICKDTPVQDNNGTVSAKDQPVIEKITVEEVSE